MSSDTSKQRPSKKMRLPHGWTIAILLLTLGGLLLRIAYLEETVIEHPFRADAGQYAASGYNLARHGVYSMDATSPQPQPDSFRPPGLPFLIALAFRLGGDDGFYDIVRHTQAVLGALVILLTFLFGRRMLPAWAAFLAAVLVALSPHLISLSSYVLTETLFSFFLLAGLLALLEGLRSQRWWWFATSGALLGYGYLINPAVVLLPWILSALLILRDLHRSAPAEESKVGWRIDRRPLARRLALLLVVFSVFWGGWALRNHLSVPPGSATDADRALATLTHGTYPGFVYKDPQYKPYPYVEDPEQPAYGESLANFIRIFSRRFSERPGRYLTWYVFEKPYTLWSWNILQGQGDVYVYKILTSLYTTSAAARLTHTIMRVLHPVVLLLAVGGFLIFLFRKTRRTPLDRPSRRARLRRPPPPAAQTGRDEPSVPDAGEHAAPLLLAATLLYYTLIYGIVFAPWPRYAIPLRPELYLFAVWGALAVARWTTALGTGRKCRTARSR